jgi:hypothetical protein
MATPWRNCNASQTLVNAVNLKWPNRDKASDGTIGNAEHATRDSDHNPWIVVNGTGVVRARDIDVDGIDAAWLAEELRLLGKAGDPRLTGGGYVIYNRRITKPDFSGWVAYTGVNPHTSHVHVSFSRSQAGFDSVALWPFLEVDFLSELSPAEQRWLYNAIGACYVKTGGVGLGDALGEMYNAMFKPGYVVAKHGPFGNALVSGSAQVFYDQGGVDENGQPLPDLSPTYGPSINGQLKAILTGVDAVRVAVSEPPADGS